MAQQVAVLKSYDDLVKCMEELFLKTDDLDKQIEQKNLQKSLLQHDIPVLRGIQQLYLKRDELYKKIEQKKEEKTRLQHNIRVLTDEIRRVSESLDCHLANYNELDRAVAEIEAEYMKILASSPTLQRELKETGDL